MLEIEKVALGKEKWIGWGINHWVCEAADGEVVDEISRGLDDLYLLKSSAKKYTDLKKAQEASAKYRLMALKKFHEDLLAKKEREDDGQNTRGRGIRRAGKKGSSDVEYPDFD